MIQTITESLKKRLKELLEFFFFFGYYFLAHS